MPLFGEPFRGVLEKPRSRAAEKQQAKRAREAAWQQVRKAVLVRDRYHCRVCGTPDAIEVHHLRFRSAGRREDSLKNCLTLCKPCHQEVHAYRLHLVGTDANARLTVERTR